MQKNITHDSFTAAVTDYIDGMVYRDDTLQYFAHEKGYVNAGPVNTAGTAYTYFEYIYQYKDHLGNVRLSYRRVNGSVEIVKEDNYYAFGLSHKGYNSVQAGGNDTAQKVKYNGKEYNEELGLNLYSMDLRSYDPATARWTAIDPVIHYDMSPYNAFDNNPVFWADPSGADAVQYNEDGSPKRDLSGRRKFNAYGSFIIPIDRMDDGDMSIVYQFRNFVADEMKRYDVIAAGDAAAKEIMGILEGLINQELQSIGSSVEIGAVTKFSELDDFSYQEKGAINGEVLNFKLSLLARFKNSGIDPFAGIEYRDGNEGIADRESIIIRKVISKVQGLRAYFKAAGSPIISAPNSFDGAGGERGYTVNGGTAIYRTAFQVYFKLASTLFHEITHAYQDRFYLTMHRNTAERQAYATEWRLADRTLRVKNPWGLYSTIWNELMANQPNGYLAKPYPY